MDWRLNGPDQDVFTRAEVVRYLKLGSARALDRLIEQGFFPRGVPLGRRLVWTGLDVACFLYLRGRCQVGPVESLAAPVRSRKKPPGQPQE